jgi:hypothetical protein
MIRSYPQNLGASFTSSVFTSYLLSLELEAEAVVVVFVSFVQRDALQGLAFLFLPALRQLKQKRIRGFVE